MLHSSRPAREVGLTKNETAGSVRCQPSSSSDPTNRDYRCATAAMSPTATVEATSTTAVELRRHREPLHRPEPPAWTTRRTTREPRPPHIRVRRRSRPPYPTDNPSRRGHNTRRPGPNPGPNRPAPVAVIPRPGADKHPTREPARSVVTVRRASVRCISVIAVCTHRRSANISRPNSYAHADLRLGIRQRQHQNAHQSQIFYVPHLIPLVQTHRLPTKPAGSAGPPDLTSI